MGKELLVTMNADLRAAVDRKRRHRVAFAGGTVEEFKQSPYFRWGYGRRWDWDVDWIAVDNAALAGALLQLMDVVETLDPKAGGLPRTTKRERRPTTAGGPTTSTAWPRRARCRPSWRAAPVRPGRRCGWPRTGGCRSRSST